MKQTKKERVKRVLSWVLIGAIVVFLIALITWKPASESVPQQTAEVSTREVKRSIELSGVVVTRRIDGADTQVIQAFVDEHDVSDLAVDKEGDASVEALDADTNGRIDSIADEPRIVGSITEYEVIFVMYDIPEGTKNGMHADVTITLEQKGDVLAVPNAALYKDGDQYKVNRITETRRIYLKRLGIDKTEQQTEAVDVEIGLEGDDYTEITSGLSDGDEVIAE